MAQNPQLGGPSIARGRPRSINNPATLPINAITGNPITDIGLTLQTFGGEGPAQKVVLTFSNYKVTIVDQGAVGSNTGNNPDNSAATNGCVLNFPEGYIWVKGAVANLTYAYSSATDANVISSVGTTQANADGDLADAGEATIIASTATAIATSAGTFAANSVATYIAPVDGTSTAKQLFLNIATSSDPTGNQTMTINGTLEVNYENLGDK